MNDLSVQKFEALKNVSEEKSNEIKKYISLLPDYSDVKQEFEKLTKNNFNYSEIKSWAKKNLTMGSIDVNIMTKVDKDNYIKDEKLSVEYNDAHAALRGFANSNLKSSVVLSAGMNPRLYAYMSQFDDFFPDINGNINKKIILKVSDYRSAMIQGKFLAKKGLWVSEYRIESGLNCGGHAFATEGYLLGPVLEEFKEKRIELRDSIESLLISVLESEGRTIPKTSLSIDVTAQGGVGTEKEHNFLLDYYKVDSVGWGSPFLLVPEATTVDNETLKKLETAKEEDLYLSDISPLGIPFNNLRGNSKDFDKEAKIDSGRPGSVCPKRFVALNKEFKEKGICTASREYQRTKIKELKTQDLTPADYKNQFNKVTEKTCTCVGLGTSALLAYGLDTKVEGTGVSVCPGPNMAYYSKKMSLKEMTHHIYGKQNVISRTDRPNMFIKELNIYIDYLKNKLEETKGAFDRKQSKYFSNFSTNLNDGIFYYYGLFETFDDATANYFNELGLSKNKLKVITLEIQNRIEN